MGGHVLGLASHDGVHFSDCSVDFAGKVVLVSDFEPSFKIRYHFRLQDRGYVKLRKPFLPKNLECLLCLWSCSENLVVCRLKNHIRNSFFCLFIVIKVNLLLISVATSF
jgi:hypothetical protein